MHYEKYENIFYDVPREVQIINIKSENIDSDKTYRDEIM